MWSRDGMSRIDFKRCRIGFPSVTNALEGRFPLQCLEVFGEVVGCDEAENVRLETLHVLVEEEFGGRFLDRSVHSLGLAIGPGMVRLC